MRAITRKDVVLVIIISMLVFIFLVSIAALFPITEKQGEESSGIVIKNNRLLYGLFHDVYFAYSYNGKKDVGNIILFSGHNDILIGQGLNLKVLDLPRLVVVEGYLQDQIKGQLCFASLPLLLILLTLFRYLLRRRKLLKNTSDK
jgi:hypothetical protein